MRRKFMKKSRSQGTHYFYDKEEFLKKLKEVSSRATGDRIIGIKRDSDDVYYIKEYPYAVQFLLTKEEQESVFCSCDKPCCVEDVEEEIDKT